MVEAEAGEERGRTPPTVSFSAQSSLDLLCSVTRDLVGQLQHTGVLACHVVLHETFLSASAHSSLGLPCSVTRDLVSFSTQ